MSEPFWDQQVKLVRAHATAGHWRGGREPEHIVIGSLGQIIRRLAAENAEDIWRFIVVTDDGRSLRSTELRALIRRTDLPEARA